MTDIASFKVVPNWQAHLNGPITAFLNKLGKQLEEEAKEICPVGLTGMLRESIHYSVVNRSGTTGRYIGPELFLQAGNDEVNYAVYVEMGHADRGGGFVEAQPFLRPVVTKYHRV